MSGPAAPGASGHPEETHQPVFVGAPREKLEALFPKYPTKQALLLPALWIVQEERGWISPQAMAEVGELLGLTPAYVKGVVTFYTMYHRHPVGRHVIQVCTTSPCHLCGAAETMEALLQGTGCGELGTTSPDGRFTWSVAVAPGTAFAQGAADASVLPLARAETTVTWEAGHTGELSLVTYGLEAAQ